MAIPFYGASEPELFAIERKAMDRPGRVLAALDDRLPQGQVVDVGAGDGFSARALSSAGRRVVPVEPAAGMRRNDRPVPWVGGLAQSLPLRTGSMAGAYSTWAYFFTGPGWDPTPGIQELHRTVRAGGPLVIVDNLGGDELGALGGSPDNAASVDQWADLGFGCAAVDTVFEFDNEDEARTLLAFYFGDIVLDPVPLTLSYRVGLFTATSQGPQ